VLFRWHRLRKEAVVVCMQAFQRLGDGVKEHGALDGRQLDTLVAGQKILPAKDALFPDPPLRGGPNSRSV